MAFPIMVMSITSSALILRSCIWLKCYAHFTSYIVIDLFPGPHKCSPECVTDRRNLFKEHRKGKYNYLAIPLQLGWKRFAFCCNCSSIL